MVSGSKDGSELQVTMDNNENLKTKTVSIILTEIVKKENKTNNTPPVNNTNSAR